MTPEAQDFKKRSESAYNKVMESLNLHGDAETTFKDYYANHVGYLMMVHNNEPLQIQQQSREVLEKLDRQFLANMSNIEREAHMLELQGRNDEAVQKKGMVAAVRAAVTQFNREMHGPNMLERVGESLYSSEDKTASVGGVQLDGLAGAAVGGGLAYWLAQKFRLDAIWTSVITVVGALLAAPLANAITDKLFGKKAPGASAPINGVPGLVDPFQYAQSMQVQLQPQGNGFPNVPMQAVDPVTSQFIPHSENPNMRWVGNNPTVNGVTPAMAVYPYPYDTYNLPTMQITPDPNNPPGNSLYIAPQPFLGAGVVLPPKKGPDRS